MARKSYSFAFGLGDKVVDETRPKGYENVGSIFRVEVDHNGIFYAVQGANTRWLAKEGALTSKEAHAKAQETPKECA